jgi:hypothetical protein
MFLRPSKAIWVIDNTQAIYNKRLEQIKRISEGLIEMGYTKSDFEEAAGRFKLTSEQMSCYCNVDKYEGKDIDICLGLLMFLETINGNELKGKLNKETVKAKEKELLRSYVWGISHCRMPQIVLKTIEESKMTYSSRFEKLKCIVKVLNKFDVKDSDYDKVFDECSIHIPENLMDALGRDKWIDNELNSGKELAVLIDTNFEPHRKSWFKKTPTDETLGLLLNQLLHSYEKITD